MFIDVSQVPQHMSRRTILTLFVFSVPALVSCRTMRSTRRPDAADEQLKRFADHYNSLARREPQLPGVAALARINNQLFAGFDAGDQRLLTAALYRRARERVSSIREPLTEADVRSALSRPIDMSLYGRPYLEHILTEARPRAARDAEFYILPPGTTMCVDIDSGATFSPGMCAFLLSIGVLALA